MRSVLHVLPHPGGGGETYVDSISSLDGYQFERMFLAEGPSPRGAVGAILARAAEAQLAARRHDLLHVHGEVAAALLLPTLALRPSVLTLHGLNLVRRLSGGRRTAAELNLRLVLRAATRTICVTQAEHDEVVAAAGHGAGLRSVVIHNGVTLPPPTTAPGRTAARAGLGLPDDAVVGLWVGGLEEHKDPRTALSAFSVAARDEPRLRLLIAGDGPLRAELELELRRNAADAAQLLGFRTDVATLLAASDFFVLTSLHEGLSYSLLEAMAAGLAPVVSDHPGNVEAAGDAGITVACGDVAGFAAAFRRLAADEAVRHALGARARTRAAERFGIAEMTHRTGLLYDKVLAGR